MKNPRLLGALLLVALVPAVTLMLRTDASGQLRPTYNFQPWPGHPEDVVTVDEDFQLVPPLSYVQLYTVPLGQWFVVTRWAWTTNEFDLIENNSGARTKKVRTTFGAPNRTNLQPSLGSFVVFPPGCVVEIQNRHPLTPYSVQVHLDGFLTPD